MAAYDKQSIYLGHYTVRDEAIVAGETWDALDQKVKDKLSSALSYSLSHTAKCMSTSDLSAEASNGQVMWYAYSLEFWGYNVGFLNDSLGATQRGLKERSE
jgi:hypothetical protein